MSRTSYSQNFVEWKSAQDFHRSIKEKEIERKKEKKNRVGYFFAPYGVFCTVEPMKTIYSHDFAPADEKCKMLQLSERIEQIAQNSPILNNLCNPAIEGSKTFEIEDNVNKEQQKLITKDSATDLNGETNTEKTETQHWAQPVENKNNERSSTLNNAIRAYNMINPQGSRQFQQPDLEKRKNEILDIKLKNCTMHRIKFTATGARSKLGKPVHLQRYDPLWIDKTNILEKAKK